MRAVDRGLNKLEKEATELKTAMIQALSVRDQGTGSALRRVERILSRTEERAIVTDARIGQLGRDVNDRGLRNFNNELDRTQNKANKSSMKLNMGSLSK